MFAYKNAWQIACVATFGLLAMILQGCGGDGSSGIEYAKWDFSGYVVDGATNIRLAGTKIEYLDGDGVGTTVLADSTGAFFITSLPYGQKVFRLSCMRIHGTDTVHYAQRIITASSVTESSIMEGVLANGSRLIKLYPLNAGVTGEVYLKVKGSGKYLPAAGASLHLQYRDTSFVNEAPEDFSVETDSSGDYVFARLPADTNMTLTVNAYEYNGTRYVATPVVLPRLGSAQSLDIGRIVLDADSVADADYVLASNVLDADGIGMVGIPVDVVPYYLLNVSLDPARLDLQVTVDDSTWDVVPELRGDTLFIHHNTRFSANSYVDVILTGVSLAGTRVYFDLSGSRRFKTGHPLHAIASNTWQTNSTYKSEFALYDTLWVRFSNSLSSVTDVQWSKASVTKSLYGAGSSANASAWVHGDTLFVMPDQRFQASSGDKFGFNVMVIGTNGELSEATEVSSTLATGAMSVAWTNAKDPLGTMRSDMKVMDSIVLVSSVPLAAIQGVSVSDSASLPPGFMPGDIALHGTDTIVFTPRIAMTPGTLYGMDFDVLTPAGRSYTNVLSVKWKTAYQVSIVSVNNRTSAGYRRFKGLGDSLVVQFSKPIDITASALLPFTVHMTDVKSAVVQTLVTWNATADIATIHNITPYPLADFGITTTTTTAGDKAKAVNAVTFDFSTSDGEVVYGLAPSSEAIKIYTEDGLCVLNTNVLKAHSSLYTVATSETPRENFPIDSAVTITFNRPLDIAYMQQGTLASFASIQSGLGVNVAATVTFADSGKTLVITPTVALDTASEYWIRLKGVPALGLREAVAISSHGGTFSGSSTTSNYLLITGFATP